MTAYTRNENIRYRRAIHGFSNSFRRTNRNGVRKNIKAAEPKQRNNPYSAKRAKMKSLLLIYHCR